MISNCYDLFYVLCVINLHFQDFCKHHASKEHAAELELSIQTYEDRLQSHQITQQNA